MFRERGWRQKKLVLIQKFLHLRNDGPVRVPDEIRLI
jgi:hypothetical protein